MPGREGAYVSRVLTPGNDGSRKPEPGRKSAWAINRVNHWSSPSASRGSSNRKASTSQSGLGGRVGLGRPRPLVSFPAEVYCGRTDGDRLSQHPDVKYLRANGRLNRGARAIPKPLFGIYLFAQVTGRRMAAPAPDQSSAFLCMVNSKTNGVLRGDSVLSLGGHVYETPRADFADIFSERQLGFAANEVQGRGHGRGMRRKLPARGRNPKITTQMNRRL